MTQSEKQHAPAELILDARAALGEGALWDSAQGVLYWVDIDGFALHIYDPASGRDRAINIGQHVGTVVPCRSGGVMLALHHGFAHLDLATERLTPVGDPVPDRPLNRFNDGKCDPAGRFWAGTFAMDELQGAAALYCLEANGCWRCALEGVSISNGIVWSADGGTMYYIDTPTHEIVAFDYDLASGAIANRRVVVRVPEGMGGPDGMSIDASGRLWVALWGGWRVACWDPATGQQVDEVKVPASQVSSCAFGGPGLDELYITTARKGLDEAALRREPHAGGIFHAPIGVRGVPQPAYGG